MWSGTLPNAPRGVVVRRRSCRSNLDLMNRRRLVQTSILLVGLLAIAYAIEKSIGDAKEQVMPSPLAFAVGGALALITILASARAWVALFSDLVRTRANRAALRSTFYLAQLTKYLPVGGIAEAASQLGLAPSAGVPLRRAAVAFPVSAVCAVVAGATLSAGLVFDTNLDPWLRWRHWPGCCSSCSSGVVSSPACSTSRDG